MFDGEKNEQMAQQTRKVTRYGLSFNEWRPALAWQKNTKDGSLTKGRQTKTPWPLKKQLNRTKYNKPKESPTGSADQTAGFVQVREWRSNENHWRSAPSPSWREDDWTAVFYNARLLKRKP